MERLYRTNGRKCFIGIFPKDFSSVSGTGGRLENLFNNKDDETLRISFKSQGYYTKLSQKNKIKTHRVVEFIEQNAAEFETAGDVSRVVVYICTHGFSSQYGQHLYFSDGHILMDHLLRPLYDCPGLQNVPLLVILHSCRKYKEDPSIAEASYRFTQNRQIWQDRVAHSKVDVGFVFSADENKYALTSVNGTSDFASELVHKFENNDDIFRATSSLGLRHSFRERFNEPVEQDGTPISYSDQFYPHSKRKKAAIIITLGEFDREADFKNADVEREEMKKLLKQMDYDVIASNKTYITLESCRKFIQNLVENSFQHGHEFNSIMLYLKTHGSWGKKGQVVHFSNDTQIPLLDLLQPFNQGPLRAIPKSIFVEACQGETKETECIRLGQTHLGSSEPRHHMLNTIFFKATTERTLSVTPEDPEGLSPFTKALKEIVNEALLIDEDINAWDLSCKLTEKMSSEAPVKHPASHKFDKFLLCQTDTTLTKNLKIFNNTRYPY